MLTPQQRYFQAVRKARIIAARELRAFMAGEIEILLCSSDRERDCLIAEIGRAFEAGRRLGSAEARAQEGATR